jgi:hypothetical protein
MQEFLWRVPRQLRRGERARASLQLVQLRCDHHLKSDKMNLLHFLLLALALAPGVRGQAVAVTSSDGLASAIRAGNPAISIESRITGLAEEQLAERGGVYALERYRAFPQVQLPHRHVACHFGHTVFIKHSNGRS